MQLLEHIAGPTGPKNRQDVAAVIMRLHQAIPGAICPQPIESDYTEDIRILEGFINQSNLTLSELPELVRKLMYIIG